MRETERKKERERKSVCESREKRDSKRVREIKIDRFVVCVKEEKKRDSERVKIEKERVKGGREGKHNGAFLTMVTSDDGEREKGQFFWRVGQLS